MPAPAVELAPPEVEALELPGGRSLFVVRDDRTPGGTKRRVIGPLLAGCEEAVYASPAEGFAQVALAVAGRELGVKASVFVAARQQRHPNTEEARAAGAELHEVRPGYFSVVKSRARGYADFTGARLLPFGLDALPVIEGLRQLALATCPEPPAEVWCVAGSGVVARGLAAAWPEARLRCVQIGRQLRPGDVPSSAEVVVAPEPFARDAEQPPPFPSCPNYDAKAWRFLLRDASDGALFWNVA